MSATETTPPVTTQDGELFNGAKYDLPLPKLDGHRPDAIKLSFAGGVEIDLMDGDQVEHFKTLRLGQELDLRISARVSKVNWTHRVTDDESGEEKVVHQIGLTVDTYSIDE